MGGKNKALRQRARLRQRRRSHAERSPKFSAGKWRGTLTVEAYKDVLRRTFPGIKSSLDYY